MGRFLFFFYCTGRLLWGVADWEGCGVAAQTVSELWHDSEGVFDIWKYWVTGSEEQEWHFQAGLSGDSVRKPNGSSYLHM